MCLHTAKRKVFQSSARINTGCNDDGQPKKTLTLVSILSPHQHGLQPGLQTRRKPSGSTFQSSARINTGCNRQDRNWRSVAMTFQSSARINTGCNCICFRHAGSPFVSILSPHQHGLQPSGLWKQGQKVSLFQSSARINTGCNGVRRMSLSTTTKFQSSARINTGCNLIATWRR